MRIENLRLLIFDFSNLWKHTAGVPPAFSPVSQSSTLNPQSSILPGAQR